MIDRASLLDLIPHAGAMCLLDRVVAWDDERIRCESRSHRSADHPLRDVDGLDALNLVEYAAQATAVHGGLLARREGRPVAPGMLTSVRDLILHSAVPLDQIEDTLEIAAHKRFGNPGGWLYDFEVCAGALRLASGRLSVMTPHGTAA